MIVALVGQPNSGKSTLFNSVAGYKTIVSNFPGTTIEFTTSAVDLAGERFDVVDIPGIYALSSGSEEERHARDHLLELAPDAIINVIDASLLGRSLELTLELAELGLPMVVCLNMMDEAERKGVRIDAAHLARDLGVPVVPTVASRGDGVADLFRAALGAGRSRTTANPFPMSRDVESLVDRLTRLVDERAAEKTGLPARLIAIKLLEGDEDIVQKAGAGSRLRETVSGLRATLEQGHGRPADVVVASERHALSMNLFEHVATVATPARLPLRDRADRALMHPFWGTVLMVAVLLGFFTLVFGLGRVLEPPLLALFERLSAHLDQRLTDRSLLLSVLQGLVQGFSGGIGIVLPYLVPFLLGLAALEDVGYIPRVAFLMDGLMHRIGLHGKAVIPFVLGYGCTVPALLGTRIMESRRDRWAAAVLVNFIPCAARSIVIFALVGFFIGPLAAAGFYLLNLVVIAAAGRLLLARQAEDSLGLILEIPPYRVPTVKALLHKVWFRLREFIVIAWPILIAGSVVLSLLEHFHLAGGVNAALAPFTRGLLGLPAETGVTLIFGVLRKELTIVMLTQALGTSDFGAVMTWAQMTVYTAFTLFYVPCLATLAALRAVIGTRGMLFTLGFTTAVALVIALAFRLIFLLV